MWNLTSLRWFLVHLWYSAAKNCYSIHYMYSLHWVLTIFSCNQCVLLYILRIGCGWRICWLILHFIVWISIPVVVGLMNPCILDLQNNYGLLLLFSLEEGFGGLIKGWIRICNMFIYLVFPWKLCIKYIFFCFLF